jgi:hypothetical protein
LFILLKGEFTVINLTPPFDTDFCFRMTLDEIVAFSAPQFQASLTCTFFIDYAQRILIEGYNLESEFKSLLAASSQSNVSRHTNLVYLKRQGPSKVDALEFTFTHSIIRPWGHRIPSACPLCKSPRSWSKPIKQGSAIIFVCKQTGCKGTCRFTKPDGVELLGPHVNGGRWMVKERSI